MKLLVVFIFITTLYSCNEGYPSMVIYQYSYNKNVVEQDLLESIKENTKVMPSKWNMYYTKFDFMDDTCVYFSESPEEMIKISFPYYENNWKNDEFIDLRVFNWFDGSKWHRNYDITDYERKRITKRLEDEVLSKMKYSYKSKKLRDSWWE